MVYCEERLDEEKHFVSVGDFCCGADDPLNLFLTDIIEIAGLLWTAIFRATGSEKSCFMIIF